MTFNFLEILQAWKIYEENVIQWWICQNSPSIKKKLNKVVT